MKHFKTAAVLVASVFLMSVLCLGVAAAGADAPAMVSEGEEDGGSPSAINSSSLYTLSAGSSSGASQTDPLGTPVSYGLRVLAARDEMVFSGLCGNEISFNKEDICRAMNLSSIAYITLTALPAPGDGTLFVGAAGAAVGQTIPAEGLSLLSFAAARPDAPCEAEMRFTVNGSGYEVNCRLCLLESINYTPTVALAPELSLEVLTFCDIPVMGSLSSYDPEGDELTYEITSYASHGRVVLNDNHTGCYTYTPAQGYVGKDAFTYVVRDQYGNYSTSATVSVQVSAMPSSLTFADLSGKDCAAAAISISASGYMNGTRVGNEDYFRPDSGMTRIEFLVTAMNVAGILPSPSENTDISCYSDADAIPEAMRPYVALALKNGYLAGRTEGVFSPYGEITRAEAAVILSNIIGYATNTTVSAFADSDSLPAWAVPALTSLRALGLLTSPDDTARAGKIMTRGETAVWLSRTLRLLGRSA